MEKLLKDRRFLIGIVVAIIVIVGGLMAYNSHRNNLEGDWYVVSRANNSISYKHVEILKVKDGKYSTNVGTTEPYTKKDADTGTFAYDKKNGTITMDGHAGTYSISDDKKDLTVHIPETEDYSGEFHDDTFVFTRKGSDKYNELVKGIKKYNADEKKKTDQLKKAVKTLKGTWTIKSSKMAKLKEGQVSFVSKITYNSTGKYTSIVQDYYNSKFTEKKVHGQLDTSSGEIEKNKTVSIDELTFKTGQSSIYLDGDYAGGSIGVTLYK